MSDIPGNLPFEQAMQRLDEIVERMEMEKMPLDEMVDAYEEGMKLLASCRQRIETARRRVELIQAGESGQATLTDFDPAAATPPSETAKTPAPARRKPAAKPEAGAESGDITLF
ncbi:MAG TPA: exodeoxyribonuclease VII small subunit [Verrucomicrobiales bacterium]|nr:exodeoxyribonuclease VII small subunit [Verrucomicrobiales bacterium]